LFGYYGHHETLIGIAQADAVRAGERARMLMALEDDDKAKRHTVRRRLATTLVQLGVRLDPEAADDLNEDVA
jgi:hypothetical protein